MAATTAISRGLSPSEAAFLCEMELVTIVPRQRLDSLDLISGPTPPLIPPHRSTIPLWLALLLRRQNRANIVPPAWMEAEALQSILDIETDAAFGGGGIDSLGLGGGLGGGGGGDIPDSSMPGASQSMDMGMTSMMQQQQQPLVRPVFSAAPKLHTLSSSLTRGNEAFSGSVSTNPAVLSPPFLPSSTASTTNTDTNPHSSTVIDAFRKRNKDDNRGGRDGQSASTKPSSAAAIPRLPYHWLEMATLLLAHAPDDFPDSDQIRRMIRDLREVRQAKTRARIDILDDDQDGARINGIGAMELVEMRGVIEKVVDGLRKVGASQALGGEHDDDDGGRRGAGDGRDGTQESGGYEAIRRRRDDGDRDDL